MSVAPPFGIVMKGFLSLRRGELMLAPGDPQGQIPHVLKSRPIASSRKSLAAFGLEEAINDEGLGSLDVINHRLRGLGRIALAKDLV